MRGGVLVDCLPEEGNAGTAAGTQAWGRMVFLTSSMDACALFLPK